jgi:sortase A
MRTWKSLVSWLFLLGGALLVFEGGSSVYPFLISQQHVSESAVDYEPAEYPGNPQARAYVVRLSLPRLNTTLLVVEGTTAAALRSGPGHLEGTPWPGHRGNSVIAGHRDTHFRVLKDVKIGDEIWIERGSHRYGYRITEAMVVKPEDTSSLNSTSELVLTLVTCYPFYYLGQAPERFVVRANAF